MRLARLGEKHPSTSYAAQCVKDCEAALSGEDQADADFDDEQVQLLTPSCRFFPY